MLNLRKVAITGSLSSGKSTVCRYFKEKGAFVVEADDIVHQLLTPNTPLGRQVIELLGADIVINHQIDRSKIAKKVFNRANLLKSLETIIHPAVKHEIDKEYEKAKNEGKAPLFVAEIPLLFEAGFDKDFDVTVMVDTDLKTCEMRYQSQDFKERQRRQMAPEEKVKKADFVIKNNGSIEDLKEQMDKLFKQLGV